MRASTTLLLAIATIGCSDHFEPEEGTWRITLDSIDDDCEAGLEDDAQPGDTSTFSLTMDKDGSGFTFTPNGPDKSPGVCTLDDRDFACDVDELSDDVQDYDSDGMDAIVTIAFDIGGRFSSDTQGSFVIAIDATCEGADCGEFHPPLPCTSALNHDIIAD